MDGLSSPEGIVALAGAAVGLTALILATVLLFKLRRLRADQRVVLGETGERDLIGHAARLERAFEELRDWVEETTSGSAVRLETAERRLDESIAHRALVRYDAYGEMSGQQSSSLALLDATRSGLVISSIHHRDSARVYVKRIVLGDPEYELSPEEEEAVQTAIGSPSPSSGA